VSGSVAPKLLFSSIPSVLKLRVGNANSRADVRDNATEELREIGASWRDLRDGFVELQPLTKDAEINEKRIEELMALRVIARKAKDFKEADRIRDELAAMGIALKDSKDPATGEITTTWEVAR
jgi:cysteinyl-tRNA synthetase